MAKLIFIDIVKIKRIWAYNSDPLMPINQIFAVELNRIFDDVIFSAVDEAFRTLLDDIFGSDVMEEYRLKRPAGYVDLMNAFESR